MEGNKTKILLLTQMHQRPLVSELFCMSALRLQEAASNQYDIDILSLVSDNPSLQVCQKYGIDAVETVARPLGTKMNSGLEFVLQNYEFDYLLKIDDDDVCDSRLLEFYTPYIKNRVPYFGIKTIYFLHAKTQHAIYYKYKYDAAKLFGPGKMLRRDVLERTGFKTSIRAKRDINHHGTNIKSGQSAWLPTYQAEYLAGMHYAEITSGPQFKLYRDDQMKSLDFESEMNLLFNGFEPMEVVTDKPVFTDVKTDVNIWSIDSYKDDGKRVTFGEATAFWSDAEKQHLKNLQ